MYQNIIIFDENEKWCLLIATEGWITYGEKLVKIIYNFAILLNI